MALGDPPFRSPFFSGIAGSIAEALVTISREWNLWFVELVQRINAPREYQKVRAATTLTCLFNTPSDVEGCSISLTQIGKYRLAAVFHASVNVAGSYFVGSIVAGDIAQEFGFLGLNTATGNDISTAMVGIETDYDNVSVGTEAKLQAHRSGNAGGAFALAQQTYTYLIAEFLG